MRKMTGSGHEANGLYFLVGDPRGGGVTALNSSVSPLQ